MAVTPTSPETMAALLEEQRQRDLRGRLVQLRDEVKKHNVEVTKAKMELKSASVQRAKIAQATVDAQRAFDKAQKVRQAEMGNLLNVCLRRGEQERSNAEASRLKREEIVEIEAELGAVAELRS